MPNEVLFFDPRLPSRFWDKVSVLASGCWEWTAGKSGDGYGAFKFAGRQWGAHRLSYSILVSGPGDLVIDHLCRNIVCVNPEHLEAKTTIENLQALGSLVPSSLNKAKTHCPRGHKYDRTNAPGSRFQRYCRVCKTVSARRLRQK